MLPVILLAAAALVGAVPSVYAQESNQPEIQQADPPPAPPPAAEPRVAVPRSEAPARAPQPDRVEPQRAQEPARAADQERRAIPRGSRPREDNPAIGVAVPRPEPQASAPPPDRGLRAGTGGVYVTPRVYNNYYYYPRRSYPYGYGAFGLGYFYYDPYRWYPGGYSYYGGPGYYGSPRSFSVFDIGELRLDVQPKHAQVFVDGYYAGIVDDYDGMFQGLKLESGGYRIDIVSPGYETLQFDVRISPGQKIRYRGELVRVRP